MIDGEQFETKLGTKKGYDFCGMVDHTGIILYVTGGYKEIMGCEPSEVIGTRLHERIHPLDRAYVFEQRNHMIKNRIPVECKYEVLTNGGYVVIRTYVTPLFDGDEFLGSVLQAKKRIVNMELFRKTHQLKPLEYAV